MTQSAPEPPSTPSFPSWPFDCLDFYNHLAKDLGRYAQAASQTDDPAQQLRAEGDYGFSLFHDVMQAYATLALAPFSMMMGAFYPRPGDTPGPGQAPPEG